MAEGDVVELNQPLVDVDTAKALVEIPSPFAGRVIRLHGAEGDVVEVGKPLVTFDVDTATARPCRAHVETVEGGPKRKAVLVGYGVEEDEAPATPAARRLRPGGGWPHGRRRSGRPRRCGSWPSSSGWTSRPFRPPARTAGSAGTTWSALPTAQGPWPRDRSAANGSPSGVPAG